MKLFDLTGRTAIVTGSSRGIGFAIADLLAEAGARVAVSSRSQADCDAAADRINTTHGAGRTFACAADLADKASLQTLVDRTREAFGPIGILICNAATTPHLGPIGTISDEQFRASMDENLLANHWLVQMAVPDMIAAKDGAIVMVSSVGGYSGSAFTGAYNIAKAGMIQMTRNLAVEYGPHNIRVNAIAPGSTRTDFARSLWDDPEKEKKLAAATCLGRIGEPEELAGAALLFASRAGSFTTGEVLLVDGGRMAWRG